MTEENKHERYFECLEVCREGEQDDSCRAVCTPILNDDEKIYWSCLRKLDRWQDGKDPNGGFSIMMTKCYKNFFHPDYLTTNREEC